MEDTEEIGRAAGPRGEVVLRRRGHGDWATYELVVNGVFAMDSAETSSEQALGGLPFAWPGARVLVGGLGLGYTAAELLRLGVAELEIAELEPALVEWAERGLVPTLASVVTDPRVRIFVTDVAVLLAERRHAPWDAILLDVDNGPDFLIHDGNAALYSADGLALAFGRLNPAGLLAVWCPGPSPDLESRLRILSPEVEVHTYRISRGERRWSTVIYLARRPVEPLPEPQ